MGHCARVRQSHPGAEHDRVDAPRVGWPPRPPVAASRRQATHRRRLIVEAFEDRRLLAGLTNSLSLDGDDDYVSVALPKTLPPTIDFPSNAFTVEAWIRHEDLGTPQTIVDKRTNMAGLPAFTFELADDRLRLFGQPGNQQIPADVWTHVAAVWERGGQQRLYINGQLDAVAGAGTSAASSTALSILTVGAKEVSATGPVTDDFAGNIGELRLWDVARRRDDIRHFMYTAVEEHLDGLVATYHFSRGTINMPSTGACLRQAPYKEMPTQWDPHRRLSTDVPPSKRIFITCPL